MGLCINPVTLGPRETPGIPGSVAPGTGPEVGPHVSAPGLGILVISDKLTLCRTALGYLNACGSVYLEFMCVGSLIC